MQWRVTEVHKEIGRLMDSQQKKLDYWKGNGLCRETADTIREGGIK
jgi:hypothetical protein